MVKKNKKQEFFRRLRKNFSSPEKVQDFLDAISFNFETEGQTCMSPVRTLREKTADCLEGALLGAAVMWAHGEVPYIMNLKVRAGVDDDDHAVTLFKRNGYWGAISKTNHSVLRYRDAVYKTPRELAMSYFHEYFLNKDGTKIMVGYSKPIDMRKFGDAWLTDEHDLWDIAETIFDAPHVETIPKKNKRYMRKASSLERKAAGIPHCKK